MVALADALIDEWFFGGCRESAWETAKAMAADILVSQVESNATDVNEIAVQFVTDWVLANRAYFGSNTPGTCYGFFSGTDDNAYIFPSILNQALSKAGYSPRKTMKYLAEKNLIAAYTERGGRKTYTIMKWFGNRSSRFVEFHIGKLCQLENPENTAPAKLPPEWEQQELAYDNCDDSDLPF